LIRYIIENQKEQLEKMKKSCGGGEANSLANIGYESVTWNRQFQSKTLGFHSSTAFLSSTNQTGGTLIFSLSLLDPMSGGTGLLVLEE